MMQWLSWYLFATLLGWLTFPIAYRYLPWIKDRGYSVSRTLGLLIWGFSFWFLASLGILPFDTGGLLIAFGILAALSALALSGIALDELKSWLRSQSSLFLAVELLFLAAFAAWAVVRAANPEALGTEKPMELAFINAILRSRAFPPHDPWLSGYAISYYHFGYVLIAMLAKITAVSGSISFNLGSALIFSLSACGSFGILYNLLNAAHPIKKSLASDKTPSFILQSFWGPVYLLIISNLEGFLHILHTRGIFWQRDASASLVSPFWSWLDLQDLKLPPAEPFSWIPDRFWWWWRASRVLQDYDLQGSAREIIDEFPFFSFLLGDLHPHVLAIPFAFLVILFALNIYLATQSPAEKAIRFQFNRIRLKVFSLDFSLVFLILCAAAIGGLAFLNTWDFPVYLIFFSAASGLAYYLNQQRTLASALRSFLKVAVVMGFFGIFLYFPFYLSFSSQAGGILPNLIYITRGAHLWVMFAPLLVPIFIYLLKLQFQSMDHGSLIRGMAASAAVFIAFWMLSLLFGWLIATIPERGQQFLGSVGASDISQLLLSAVRRRFSAPGAWITLLILLGFVLAYYFRVYQHHRSSEQSGDEIWALGSEAQSIQPNRVQPFILLLILTGLLMVLIPEFFYLLDFFGWRMNTIFKFYYQAWLVWSVAAAFSTASIFNDFNVAGKWLARTTLTLTLAASLVYPTLSLWNKTNGFNPRLWTLDGAHYFTQYSPDEAAAVEWLKQAPFGVIAEAVPSAGGSYTEYARAATFSGLPGVLGWVGHENQWRGGNEAQGSRQGDLARLFCSRDWAEAQQILENYQIRYVILGNLERAAYLPGSDFCQSGLHEEKFFENMNPVFSSGEVTIFENMDS